VRKVEVPALAMMVVAVGETVDECVGDPERMVHV
jgi:hypothetical protein